MKPLDSHYDLTAIDGAKIRRRGWKTIVGLEACVDCGKPTSWRNPDGLAQHPYPCDGKP